MVHAYAPTSRHGDQPVENIYEDVESAMSKEKTQNTVLMGVLNAKVGKKQAGNQVVVEYRISSRNSRDELLVDFAECNNLRIMDAFFQKR